jgi:hypothetical protein
MSIRHCVVEMGTEDLNVLGLGMMRWGTWEGRKEGEREE